MKWNLDCAFSTISTSIPDRYKQRKLAVRPSAQWLYCAGTTGVHADAQYLLELEIDNRARTETRKSFSL